MKKIPKGLSVALPPEVLEHISHLETIRQDFVANVSHELRTPLTVIHGYLELLMDEAGQTEFHKKIYLQMQQQTLRMENLVENLLLLSKLESEDSHRKTEKTVDVAKLLNFIVEEAKVLSASANHVIKIKADKNLNLLGQEDELRSLFSNIIFNAVKYTPANGNIQIEWYADKDHAYFKVTDTGIGIDIEHLPRLTERFYRVDLGRSRESGGTGLGLAIVKHILIRHDAELKIESKKGKGSTFICVFPESRIKSP